MKNKTNKTPEKLLSVLNKDLEKKIEKIKIKNKDCESELNRIKKSKFYKLWKKINKNI